MKYLKLKTKEKLPLTKEGKESHITFAYFGSVVPRDIEDLRNKLTTSSTFTLTKIGPDLFGPNNDIPVIVYNIDGPGGIKNVREEIITENGISDQNMAVWRPHISSTPLEESPDVINVTGIESNDDTINVDFVTHVL
jgi:hypothetical protein